MARRGGVKRISAMIYEDVRAAMTDRLKAVSRTFSHPRAIVLTHLQLIQECCVYVEYRKAKSKHRVHLSPLIKANGCFHPHSGNRI